MRRSNKVLLALGGNAIQRPLDHGTTGEMRSNIKKSAESIARMVHRLEPIQLTLAHGNGPQVGAIFKRNQLCKGTIPAWYLEYCVAASEGMIGYMFQQELSNALVGRSIATLITQMVVDANDPAFLSPSKPIGCFYSEKEAQEMMTYSDASMKEDAGRGWRQVVPSPTPIRLVEGVAVKALIDAGVIVIAAGGGGIPVVEDHGILHGLDGVIDKDAAAVVLGEAVGATTLVLVTDVESCYSGYGTSKPTPILKLTPSMAKTLEDEFSPGSMLPKVRACAEFVKKPGNVAIICGLSNLEEAILGKGGTHFKNDTF